ncbi:MAG: hypothetical protein ABSG74_13535 [Candidatus Bathyarchaeia archaeon]
MITEVRQEKFSLSHSVMLAEEMTREALRLVFGQDARWVRANIAADQVQHGRFMLGLMEFLNEEDAASVLHDEVVRNVSVRALVEGSDGRGIPIAARAYMYNFRCQWEPGALTLEIDRSPARSFSWVNKWENGRYTSTVRG